MFWLADGTGQIKFTFAAVAHALLRAASSLYSTPLRPMAAGVGRSAVLSGLVNFQAEPLAEHAEGRFQLIQPGGVAQVEQPVHLGEIAVQAAA